MSRQLSKPYFHRYRNLPGDLTGVHFACMKVVPAMYVVERALYDDHLRRQGEPATHYAELMKMLEEIWETTSGTAGLGLAHAVQYYREKGELLRLGLVGDNAIETNRLLELQALGAEVHLVDADQCKAAGGIQAARMQVLTKKLAEKPQTAYWTKQYDNREWALAYYSVAAECVEELGRIDVLVCGTGSGASSAGMYEGLRMACPDCRLVGVDAIGSVLFDAPELHRGKMRGIGMSIKPGNLRSEYFSGVNWVSARFAWSQAHWLIREHGVSVGPTTGAAFAVARHIAEDNPHERVLFLGADDSKRYEPTIFDSSRLQADNLWLDPLPSKPRLIDDPSVVNFNADWWQIDWHDYRIKRAEECAP